LVEGGRNTLIAALVEDLGVPGFLNQDVDNVFRGYELGKILRLASVRGAQTDALAKFDYFLM
jgi:hypothetical protein